MSTVKQLRSLAEERGVDVSSLRSKAEIAAALDAVEVTAASPAAVSSAFDVVGEDGRRIVRGHAYSACAELVNRIRLNGSDEELTIVPSPEA